MRVICLVPSLTETLIECGVNVVGRTRFCIHPAQAVRDIKVVGGTKEVNWALCTTLKPDLVIFDKEENTREMAETCPFRWIATHITSIDLVGSELKKLAVLVDSPALGNLADAWQVLADRPALGFEGWDKLPGLISRIGPQDDPFDTVEYMIWRDPWMAVSRNTFIGSVLEKVGVGYLLSDHNKPYPVLDAADHPSPRSFYLFSSEPFPFERFSDELASCGFRGALVDGELYSWFGLRSYRLLQSLF